MTIRQQALISVTEKNGIVEFSRALFDMKINLLSTGGTAHLLQKNDIPVTLISDYTKFPEIMDGRVKTLHPKIYGGILGRKGEDDHIMNHYDIDKIDLVVVNLYPFQQIIQNPKCSLSTAIENIDIGGVTLIRAAAKNYQYVTVIVDPNDYSTVLTHLENGTLTELKRFELAKKAFQYIADYDAAIANYLNGDHQALFPSTYSPQYLKKQDLRYGENPHQTAAFYRESENSDDQTISSATQLQGKALSFNNIADADTALECVKHFSAPACVIVKHANPCGVAIGNNILEAYQKAFDADPTSAFGGIIAFNKKLDFSTAKSILEKQFVEVIIAPQVEDEARIYLQTKTNIRILTHKVNAYQNQSIPSLDYKRVKGGLLIQASDSIPLNTSTLQCVSNRTPTENEYQDLLFAWKVVKFVKSNAIVIAKNLVTLGIGGGQTSRVYSAKIASMKAADVGQDTLGAVMASDAFFPFRDGIEMAAQAGISAIIQPGGSMRDTEIIEAANAANIAMLFTGIRHFRH